MCACCSALGRVPLAGIIHPVLRAISPITVAANIGVLVRGREGPAWRQCWHSTLPPCFAVAPSPLSSFCCSLTLHPHASCCLNTVTLQGLALYSVGFPGVAACPQLGIMQIVFVILFSQVRRRLHHKHKHTLLAAVC